MEVVNSRSFKQKNAAEEITYRVRPRRPNYGRTVLSVQSHLIAVFKTILSDARRRYNENSLFRLYINHPKLNSPMVFKPQWLHEVSAEALMAAIEYRISSAGDIPIDGLLIINIAVCRIIGGDSRVHTMCEKTLLSKRSVISIRNNDNLCLARAIVVGNAHTDMSSYETSSPKYEELKKKFKKLCDRRNIAQKEKAQNLATAAGIPISRRGLMTDVPFYEKVIGKKITVLSTTCGNGPLYKGCEDFNQSVMLYHTENEHDESGHFDVITRMNAFVSKRHFCKECMKGYERKERHSCRYHCNICGRDNCTKDEEEVSCRDCNRSCRSINCYHAHKKVPKNGRGKNKGKGLETMCEKYWQCVHCSHVMPKSVRPDHVCGETLCQHCRKWYAGNYHQCYVRNVNPESKVNKMIFFDFECTQDDGVHEPNLVVAQSACSKCKDIEEVTKVSVCSFCGSRCFLCSQRDPKTREYLRDFCFGCGRRQMVFSGKSTVTDFCSWLLTKNNEGVVVIAHNAKAYDNYFIFNFLVKKGVTPEPIIMSGSKIMYMKVASGLNITFLDSINFLPMALSKLPKSFGMSELKKGYFPHLYNTKANQGREDITHPPAEMYSPDTMSKEAREDFFDWYEKNKNKPFNLEQEMLDYCVSDVDILRRACCRFQKLVQESTGTKTFNMTDDGDEDITWDDGAVDPFSCMTIASVCMKIFRAKFVPEMWQVIQRKNAIEGCLHGRNCKCKKTYARRQVCEGPLELHIANRWVHQAFLTEDKDGIVHERFLSSKIALLPNSNVLAHDICSKQALQWLRSEEEKRGVDIQTALSPEGEKVITVHHDGKVKHLKLDGYFMSESGHIAFEYNGCCFHGCPSCHPTGRQSTLVRGKSLHVRYRETLLKERLLKENGFTVITKWQHDFDPSIHGHVELPINLKDCYFGGRTNALVLHKIMKHGEKGYYYDFTSLYPSVLKYKRYPIGHPVRIEKGFAPFTRVSECGQACQCEGVHLQIPYFGVMKVTVLPPTNLHIPVLPLRVNGKLKFPLCLSCAKAEKKSACSCLSEERQFTGTYCTPELEVAINLGYKILHIHEVLHWEESEIYNRETKEGGLFTGYINTFLKLKQQASGYPPECQTEEQKLHYISSYKQREGIQLDREKIEKNPGLRSLSKLALNSFYGKFGQRDNLGKNELVNTLEGLYNILLDDSKELTNWHIMTEDVMLLEYTTNEKGFDLDSISGNVVIAAFCTCWARLQLFHYMKKIGERVLYHDTDSVIFTASTNDYIPPTGEYLGDFTDELACKEVGCKGDCHEGHWISEFIACGPKNYAYKLNTGQVVCKVRGFSLNYQNSQVLNFESMKRALFSWKQGEREEFETITTSILRDKHTVEVFTKKISKKYNVVYDKRVVRDDFTTRPFGFQE